jgi:hypothetical protein
MMPSRRSRTPPDICWTQSVETLKARNRRRNEPGLTYGRNGPTIRPRAHRAYLNQEPFKHR